MPPARHQPSRHQPSRIRQLIRRETIRQIIAKPAVELVSASGLAMVAAIAFFSAGDVSKAILAAAIHVGLLISPLVVTLVARAGWRVAKRAELLGCHEWNWFGGRWCGTEFSAVCASNCGGIDDQFSASAADYSAMAAE